MSAEGSRRLFGLPWRTAVVIVVLLFAAVVARWATSSFDDSVHLVAPATLPDGVKVEDLPKAARFHCPAPFGDGDVTPTAEVAEALELQTLSREPCDSLRTQRKVLAIADGGLVVVLLGGLAALSLRPRRAVADPVA